MRSVDTPSIEGNERFSFAFAKWSIFGVLIFSYILVYFHRMAPGVVSSDLLSAFAISGAQLGALSSMYFVVYACMQLPSGVVADTLGARTSIITGNLVAGAGSIVFGLAGNFGMACLGRFLVGLGVSVVFVSIMKSNSVWFHERFFALMSGITLLIGNLGSVLAAGPLAALLTVFEWRTVFIGIGGISLLLAAMAGLIVENRPEDIGFAAPNRYRQSSGPKKNASWHSNLRSVLAVRRLWPGFWVQFGMTGSLYAFMGLWGMRYLQDVQGVSRATAAGYITAMLLCFAAGSLFFGWASDRIGRRKPIIVGCVFGYLAAWLILTYAQWTPGAFGYALFGFMGMTGAGFVVTFAAAKEVIHPDLSGMAVSVVNTGCFVGTAIMQPLFGRIMDFFWDGAMIDGVRMYSAADYQRGFLLAVAFSGIAIIGAVRLHETGGRNIVAENQT